MSVNYMTVVTPPFPTIVSTSTESYASDKVVPATQHDALKIKDAGSGVIPEIEHVLSPKVTTFSEVTEGVRESKIEKVTVLP